MVQSAGRREPKRVSHVGIQRLNRENEGADGQDPAVRQNKVFAG